MAPKFGNLTKVEKSEKLKFLRRGRIFSAKGTQNQILHNFLHLKLKTQLKIFFSQKVIQKKDQKMGFKLGAQ